jgi:hypothetical protein
VLAEFSVSFFNSFVFRRVKGAIVTIADSTLSDELQAFVCERQIGGCKSQKEASSDKKIPPFVRFF